MQTLRIDQQLGSSNKKQYTIRAWELRIHAIIGFNNSNIQ